MNRNAEQTPTENSRVRKPLGKTFKMVVTAIAICAVIVPSTAFALQGRTMASTPILCPTMNSERPNFTDADENGVCDNYEDGVCQGQGNGQNQGQCQGQCQGKAMRGCGADNGACRLA